MATIRTEQRGRVGVITLDRPEALNALNDEVMADALAAATAFDRDAGTGALVITGSERAFAAGADVKAMVAFYEMALGLSADWLAPVFAEIVTPSATLALGSAETVALFKEGSAEPGANRTAIIEFQVEDVDAEFERLKGKVDFVHAPKMMPWGNKTLQFRDPENNIAAFYMPVTDAAKARFGSR